MNTISLNQEDIQHILTLLNQSVLELEDAISFMQTLEDFDEDGTQAERINAKEDTIQTLSKYIDFFESESREIEHSKEEIPW